MPTTPPEDLVMFSLRIPWRIAQLIEATANHRQIMRARLCRRVFEDAFGFFGVPAPMAEVLQADCKALGHNPEDPREYFVHLLTLRYADILTGKVDISGRTSKK
jgi:hypothetical protein